MEHECKEVLLKNGKICLIRLAEDADAERMIDYLRITAEETPFLGREPEEASFTLEHEREIIRNMNMAERSLLLLAEVDGVHAGNANLSCVGDLARLRHRCSMGVGLYRTFWGMGIGSALLAAAQTAGYEQAELEVVRDSYSDSLAPLLSQRFGEIHLLDLRYYRTGVDQYARENGIDRILVCYSVENFIKDVDAVFLGQ